MGVFFAGVDLGTSGIKAGVIGEEGDILAQVYWDTELVSSGPGKMEQDPDFFYYRTLQILHAALEQSGVNPSDIAGLAIDGQMGGIIGIDAEFNSITGLDMGLDIRSERYNALLHEEYGENLAGVTCGSPRNTPKMMMWRREHPEVYGKVRKFVTLSGYVTGKLAGLDAGNAFIDYTLLSFFGNEDARRLSWSEELTRALELDMEKLPRVVDPWDAVGKLTEEAARESGLPAGLPVMAGAGDQPAGYLGAAFLRPGQLLDVSGSTTLMCCSVDSFIPDREEHTVMYMPSVVKGKYTAFTYINGGGISLKWFRDEFAAGLSWEDLSGRITAIAPGSGGLLFIPYFGGRQCPYNSELRGSWIGLNWGHTKAHLFRAVLEGLSYDYAAGLEAIAKLFPECDMRALDGTGGGSANAIWNQIKADVLNIPYRQLGDYQFALRGCALIIGYSLGIFPDMQKAAEVMNKQNERKIFEPDSQQAGAYRALIEIFKGAAASSIEETMHRLHGA